jgi:serine/threonine protein kinase
MDTMGKKIPRQFGKCAVAKQLGRGAQAWVFLAKHGTLNMPVAVKVLRRKLSEGRPEYAKRFLREARMAAWLQHPNIVRVIDCGVEEGYHYMVMDYIDGQDCEEKLRETPEGMPWRQAVEIVRQASQGLGYAATKDVIHRDVKPSNIMVTKDGRALMSDLGLAKLTAQGVAGLTQELHTVGTPNYMSPEQIRADAELDFRADIYSLGATLYHLLTGRPPFEGKNPMEVVAHHLTRSLTPPHKLRPDLPKALSSIVCKMMAKRPQERYQSYEDLIEDLDGVLSGTEVEAEGFEDSRAYAFSDSEVREVLEELDFAEERLEIDIDDEDDVPPSTDDMQLVQAGASGPKLELEAPRPQTAEKPPQAEARPESGELAAFTEDEEKISAASWPVGAESTGLSAGSSQLRRIGAAGKGKKVALIVSAIVGALIVFALIGYFMADRIIG